MLTLKKAEKEDLETVADLAKEIWHEHYDGLLGTSQVDYMLQQFQSVPALSAQLEEGYFYKLMLKDGKPVGFYGAKPEKERMFLSKLYLRAEERGKGYARIAFDDLCAIARAQGKSSVYLTVNKQNAGSIAVYRKFGFVMIEEVKTEIGQGYFMDDYIMETKL